MAIPQGPNQRWSLDFLSDQLNDSRRFRILAVVDDFTRECLALVADTSLSGLRVGHELDAIVLGTHRKRIASIWVTRLSSSIWRRTGLRTVVALAAFGVRAL